MKEYVSISLGSIPCNMGCAYCSVGRGLGASLPSFEDVTYLFSESGPLSEVHNHIVHVFAETEPTLNKPGIDALLALSSQGRIQPLLTTNATDLELVMKLAMAGWLITVSFDGLEHQQNRPARGGQNTQDNISKAIQTLAALKKPFLVRITVRNWNTISATLEYLECLGATFIETSQILPLGLGQNIEPSNGDPWQLVYQAVYHSRLNVFTPVSGRGFCPLAGNGGTYWVLGESGWRPTLCYVDTSLVPALKLKHRARRDGCLIKPIDSVWREVSQHPVLIKGREAWQNILGVPAQLGGGCCI